MVYQPRHPSNYNSWGGAYISPHLLMLSGIGPKAELEAVGTTVVKDLPGVGKNLQDQGMAPLAYYSRQPVTLAGASEPVQAELFAQGMGLLTSDIAEAPDLRFHFAPNRFIADGAGNLKVMASKSAGRSWNPKHSMRSVAGSTCPVKRSRKMLNCTRLSAIRSRRSITRGHL